MLHLSTKLVLMFILGMVLTSKVSACDLPSAPGNTSIASSSAHHVEFACNKGYFLSDGELTLTCVNNTWNGTMPVCKAKVCSNLTVSPTMIAEKAVAYGDQVLVTCIEGYALSVDKTQQTPVIIDTSYVTCEDDPLSIHGQWGNHMECTVLDCGTPPTSNNMLSNNTGLSIYGTTIKYGCYSGYKDVLYDGAIATCGGNATWEITPSDATLNCFMSANFFKCRPNGTITEVFAGDYNNGIIGSGQCISKCKTLQKRLAALSSDGCYCSDAWTGSTTSLPVEQCNSTCQGSDGITKTAFCGGPNNEQSTFLTLTGCYSDITLNSNPVYIEITGDLVKTCKEYCLGKDAFYAILFRNTSKCVCTNETSTTAVTRLPDRCEGVIVDSDLIGKEFGNIYNLLKESPSATDCAALYKKGVRLNGVYHLNGINDKDMCIFKDSTICDEGWIGYSGSCYYFHNGSLDYSAASAYCLEYNSTLTSILDQSEDEFIDETLTAFPDFSNTAWYIGLYDHHAVLSFTWTDGNLFRFDGFTSTRPSGQGYKCIHVNTTGITPQWFDGNCNMSLAFICKKPSDVINPKKYSCIQNLTAIDVTYTKTSDMMSMTKCIQVCLGQNSTNALTNGDNCYCAMSLSSYKEHDWSTCSVNCRGHGYQSCGGTDPDVYSVATVDSFQKAESCQDLEVQGISDSTFVLESGSYVYCNDTGCPYSWIKGKSSCYKFMTGQKISDNAVKSCSKYHAYLVSINDEEELDFLYRTISDVPSYSSSSKSFLTGVSIVGASTVRYASAEDSNSSIAFPMTDVHVVIENSELKPWDGDSDSTFICEKSAHYVGCFELDTVNWILVSVSDVWLTVRTCIELCRTKNKDYAGLHVLDCYCGDTLPLPKTDEECFSTQYRYSEQLNGGESSMSVYDVGQYPVSSGSCEDLFDRGIRINAEYVTSNGTVYCRFFDNTTCPTGWIGYKDKCYYYIYTPSSLDTHASACASLNATLVTIRDEEEHNFIKNWMSGHEVSGFTNAYIGSFDEFKIFSISWVDGSVTSYLPLTNDAVATIQNSLALYPSDGYKYKPNDMMETFSAICQINKDHIGCYGKPLDVEPILSNYSSMDLTLCKQLCMVNRSIYIMVQDTTCYCINYTDQLISSTSEQCSVPCSRNKFQTCGSTSVVNVYFIDYRDVPEYCDLLYRYGIFYNTTYLLKNSSTDTDYQESTCGFTDESSCPRGWQRHKGTCYLVYLQKLGFEAARTECANNDGYLLTPAFQVQVNFLKDFLSNVQQFSSHETWWTGIIDAFYAGGYLGADGSLLLDGLWEENDTVNGLVYTSFSSNTTKWSKTEISELPFICEKSAGYLGCTNNVLLDFEVNITKRDWMTATQCIQFCLGQDFQIAALFDDGCSCTNTSVGTQATDWHMCGQCPGYSTQLCGSTSGYMSLYDIDYYKDNIAKSCEQLFQHGVIEPGGYYISPLLNGQRERVQCFTYSASISQITEYETTVSASSVDSAFTASKSSIKLPYSSDDVWKPLISASHLYLQFTFQNDYIVTGVISQGRPSLDVLEYVTEFSLNCRIEGGTWEQYQYQIQGPKDRIIRALYYLPFPVVCHRIRLKPKSWIGTAPSVRVTILGQKFSEFNHTSSYIGCYGIFDNYGFIVNGTGISNATKCKANCAGLSKPFYTQDKINETCLCGTSVGYYGKYDDEKCSKNTSNAFAVYRTYDKHCLELPDILNAVRSFNYKHNSGIFTVTSTITYTCIPGYVFPDNTTSKTSECLQDNSWSVANQTHCNIGHCPAITIPLNGEVSTTNTTYGTIITITCNTGHVLADNLTTRDFICQSNLEWNDSFVDCTARPCGDPPALNNTSIIGTDYSFNKTVTYVCHKFALFPSNTSSTVIRCQENGSWETAPSGCSYYTCPDPPPTLSNAVMIRSDNIVTFTCNNFFRFTDGASSHTLECSSNLEWPSVNYTCAIDDDTVFKKSAKFHFVGKKLRTDFVSNNLLKSKSSRSLPDCANSCLKHEDCDAYNYNSYIEESCRTYHNINSMSYVLENNDSWLYYERESLDFVGF